MLRHLAGLMGPIFVKEVTEIARRRRFYLSRTLYGLALVIILVLVWQEQRWHVRNSVSLNAAAYLAEELFTATSIVQFGGVFLFVPLFLCGTIAGEREERTLEVLFSTHLSDRDIVLGKLGSRLAAMACLIFCGLPVLSLLMTQGGIAPESLWRVLTATFLGILFTAAHAMYFSATTGSTIEALVRTYWWLAVWLIGVPVLGMMAFELMWGPWRTPPVYLFGPLLFVNPLGPMIVAVDGSSYNLMARFLGAWYFPAAFVAPTAWSLFLLWLAMRRLRQTPMPVLQWLKGLPGLRWLWRFVNRPEALARRRAHAQLFARRCLVTNPLWLRARLTAAYDRSGHIRLIQWAGWATAVLVIVLVAIFDPRELGREDMSMGLLSVAWAGIAGLAALLAGTSLVGDRRRGFLELVLVTPLTGQEIVDGTFRAVWEHLRPILWLPWAAGLLLSLTGASPSPGIWLLWAAGLVFSLTGVSPPLGIWLPWTAGLVFSLTGASPAPGILVSLITATLYCGVLVWHGLACSLVAPTVPAALTATFAFPLIAMGGTGLVMGIFQDEHGPVLWILSLAAWAIAWRRERRGLGLGTVAFRLISVHLALTALATCWTYDGRRDEFPGAAMQPAFLVIVVLDDRPETWFRSGSGDFLPWFPILLAYWLALVVNVVWMRGWLIEHFDTLAGRTAAEQAAAEKTGAERNAAEQAAADQTAAENCGRGDSTVRVNVSLDEQ